VNRMNSILNKTALIISLLITIQLLLADVTNSDNKVEDNSVNLMQTTDDISEMLSSAYDHFLSSKYSLAIKEYRKCIGLDSMSVESWRGLLLSYNAMFNWTRTIKDGSKPIRLFPFDPAINNAFAFALFNRFNSLSAHKYYKAGLLNARNVGDITSQKISYEGMGWIYLVNNDYSKTSKAFKQASYLDPNYKLPDSMNKVNHSTEVQYAFWDQHKKAYTFNHETKYQRFVCGLGFEQIDINNKKYRQAYSGTIGIAAPISDFRLSTIALRGKDTQYPADVYQLGIAKKFWFNQALVIPEFKSAFSKYQHLNAYQNELSIQYRFKRLGVNYAIVNIQKDVDIVDGDTDFWMYHTNLNYIFSNGIIIDLSFGIGEQDWWVTPSGTVIDTDNTYSRFIGNSIIIPFLTNDFLIWYHQLGTKQGKNQYLGSVQIKVTY